MSKRLHNSDPETIKHVFPKWDLPSECTVFELKMSKMTPLWQKLEDCYNSCNLSVAIVGNVVCLEYLTDPWRECLTRTMEMLMHIKHLRVLSFEQNEDLSASFLEFLNRAYMQVYLVWKRDPCFSKKRIWLHEHCDRHMYEKKLFSSLEKLCIRHAPKIPVPGSYFHNLGWLGSLQELELADLPIKNFTFLRHLTKLAKLTLKHLLRVDSVEYNTVSSLDEDNLELGPLRRHCIVAFNDIPGVHDLHLGDMPNLRRVVTDEQMTGNKLAKFHIIRCGTNVEEPPPSNLTWLQELSDLRVEDSLLSLHEAVDSVGNWKQYRNDTQPRPPPCEPCGLLIR